MKKLLLPMLIASSLAITACCDCKIDKSKAESHVNAAGDKNESGHEENSDTHNTAENVDSTTVNDNTITETDVFTLGAFDWNAKASDTSSADIGASPYFKLPEGMMVVKNTNDLANQNVTKTIKSGQVNIYDGENVSINKGVLSYLDIIAEGEQEFSQDTFDNHVTESMKSIGAVEFYNDTVPNDIAKKIAELDGISNEDYMTGAFSDRKLRQFAVNHDGGQLFYQIMSDDKHGEIGVLEIEGFTGKAIDPSSLVSLNPEETKVVEKVKEEREIKEVEEPVVKEDPKTESQPTASGMKEQLNNNGKAILNIKFESAKVRIRKDNLPIIEQIYTLLKDNPTLKISIEGHTDSSGKAEMNQKLSVWRAKEVKAKLEKKGIDSARIKATGFGEDKPIVGNDTNENRAKNRRVELVKFD